MPQRSDRQLLIAITAGDNLALRELYGRHAARVYNTALSYLQEAKDAEEVTQDVFTKIWRNASGFAGNSQVTTWMYRITVNTALTALKKKQRRGVLGLLGTNENPPDFTHPRALLEEKESNQLLFAAIYRLPGRQKTAFVLSYVEELPRQQVADVMNLSLKAVESLLIRAKKGLKISLSSKHPNRGKKKKR